MSEKEFPPSIKRLEKARREGKVVKSQLVSVAIACWTIYLVIIPTLSWVRNGSLIQWLDYKAWTPQVALVEATLLGCKAVGVLIGVLALSVIVASVIQTKGFFAPMQLARGFEQCQPTAYLGRVRRGAGDACFGFIRCIVIAVSVTPIALELLVVVPGSILGSRDAVFVALQESLQSVFARCCWAITGIALVAYVFVRWRFFKGQRMSLQEVRDEHREDEGDQHTKAARKQEHKAMIFSEIENRVKNSKVVVVRRASCVD